MYHFMFQNFKTGLRSRRGGAGRLTLCCAIHSVLANEAQCRLVHTLSLSIETQTEHKCKL